MAVKAKQWLKANGHIKEISRGRISHANHVLLQEAHENGVEFSDWNPGKVAVMVTESTDAEGHVTETVTAHRIDGYQANGMPVDVAPYLYNHDSHAAYELESGQKRSLREVCVNDGVSLVQCTCGAPRVVATNGVGHTRVSIVAETSKPYAGNVWDAPARKR